MDTLNQYLETLAATAQRFLGEDPAALDAMMYRTPMDPTFRDLIALRVQLLGPQDYERVGELLETGCFDELTGDHRLAAIKVSSELIDERSKLDVSRRFQKYSPGQPLFIQCPGLWSVVRNSELVACTHTRHIKMSCIVEVPGGWSRLDPFLSPNLLDWVESTFPSAPIFIRLDPWFVTEAQPILLNEEVVRPARPDWWKTLSLRPREHDGGHYVLQEPISGAGQEAHKEYHLLGVRTLEVHASRDTAGNLSLMIEELIDDRQQNGRVLGRCLHLDTDSSVGTDANAAPLNHLDLAINVYFGQVAARRRAIKLSDGQIEKASVRTHILRVEGVPFSSSAEFARQFFCSTLLLGEWMRDQFGVLPNSVTRE